MLSHTGQGGRPTKSFLVSPFRVQFQTSHKTGQYCVYTATPLIQPIFHGPLVIDIDMDTNIVYLLDAHLPVNGTPIDLKSLWTHQQFHRDAKKKKHNKK